MSFPLTPASEIFVAVVGDNEGRDVKLETDGDKENEEEKGGE